ncbi:hypothetical protein E2K93_12465 [Thalassotalea sp. HSM 43]|uniref:hypothetical protein n=1 Tax=Thalassotalea sp. HSM 43 TaxID=2552945 RepID=UPI00107FEABF|nr:hypothetical protein [Thalassotalea sp. HSM 43]QBY05146.1 hypothetical protein E2K93_12465 [Thalassotalea sp. HSM 43]
MATQVHSIVKSVYDLFHGMAVNGEIPINLRAPSIVGTTQDDPFDNLILDTIKNAFPNLEVVSAGKLTTPDVVIRDRNTGVIVGLEVKKLIQKANGADSRGLTIDYNSCLPCGTMEIKVGNEVTAIPVYYFFALLSNDSTSIKTLSIIDGDFINNDFDLHKHAKLANQSEYGHGSYGEGSVRHRAMYTYANPLNSKLDCFFERRVLVMPTQAASELSYDDLTSEIIIRKDIQGNQFSFTVLDNDKPTNNDNIREIDDLFDKVKARKPKHRNVASMVVLDEI